MSIMERELVIQFVVAVPILRRRMTLETLRQHPRVIRTQDTRINSRAFYPLGQVSSYNIHDQIWPVAYLRGGGREGKLP